MAIAKLFKIGRGQAVRLPKEFGFEGKEVRIRRLGNGVMLEPMKFDSKNWLAELERLRGDLILPDGRNQPSTTERELDFASSR